MALGQLAAVVPTGWYSALTSWALNNSSSSLPAFPHIYKYIQGSSYLPGDRRGGFRASTALSFKAHTLQPPHLAPCPFLQFPLRRGFEWGSENQ